jgi:hypothetical protein
MAIKAKRRLPTEKQKRRLFHLFRIAATTQVTNMDTDVSDSI